MYIPYIYLFFDKISWVFLGIRGIPPGSAPGYGRIRCSMMHVSPWSTGLSRFHSAGLDGGEEAVRGGAGGRKISKACVTGRRRAKYRRFGICHAATFGGEGAFDQARPLRVRRARPACAPPPPIHDPSLRTLRLASDRNMRNTN